MEIGSRNGRSTGDGYPYPMAFDCTSALAVDSLFQTVVTTSKSSKPGCVMEASGSQDEGYADQETYFLPAEDQRVFGAGIKRQRVPFVPASSDESNVPTKPRTAVGDRYLSIVLKTQEQKSQDDESIGVCEVCGQPVKESHESSISHQLCLEHSHPPSHLPREHVGLKILGKQGWDPDSRLGLGVAGGGIRVPIKSKIKNNTAGLGVETKQRNDGGIFEVKAVEGVKRLNAKEVRLEEAEGRKRAQKLQQNFYGDDLSKYLGPGG
jgi:hypothetical protein